MLLQTSTACTRDQLSPRPTRTARGPRTIIWNTQIVPELTRQSATWSLLADAWKILLTRYEIKILILEIFWKLFSNLNFSKYMNFLNLFLRFTRTSAAGTSLSSFCRTSSVQLWFSERNGKKQLARNATATEKEFELSANSLITLNLRISWTVKLIHLI